MGISAANTLYVTTLFQKKRYLKGKNYFFGLEDTPVAKDEASISSPVVAVEDDNGAVRVHYERLGGNLSAGSVEDTNHGTIAISTFVDLYFISITFSGEFIEFEFNSRELHASGRSDGPTQGNIVFIGRNRDLAFNFRENGGRQRLEVNHVGDNIVGRTISSGLVDGLNVLEEARERQNLALHPGKVESFPGIVRTTQNVALGIKFEPILETQVTNNGG